MKNRAPAPIQITAEQILHGARADQGKGPQQPEQRIADEAELAEFRMRKRKEFEDRLRMQRHYVSVWLTYAAWEESQYEIERARSVFERALDVDFKDTRLWLRYANMEMKHKFINRARNVLDRACALLPRVDAFWYRYVYMEEMVGNSANARAVFERWMEWEPEPQAWRSYVNFEQRAGEPVKARAVFERFILCHPTVEAYLQYAKWEAKAGQRALARRVFERAAEEIPLDQHDEELYIAYASFEERCREFDRARAIFEFAQRTLPEEAQVRLAPAQLTFEKKHGSKSGLESVVLDKRREAYEKEVEAAPRDYDTWFDYARLEEEALAEGAPGASVQRVREVYQRAERQVPPVAEKVFWKRYIYLWINHAVFEELEAEDVSGAQAVYAQALRTIPHETFTFSKLWLLAAYFEVRQGDLTAARRLLGQSLGRCPRQKVLREYIGLELQLGNIDRCRALHQKMLELFPDSATAWQRFADLELSVGEVDRARAVFEIAVAQPSLDTPELVWKAYLDMEIDQEEWTKARTLYERLLDRGKALPAWLSFASFEASHAGSADNARAVYKRGYEWLKNTGAKEDCVKLLHAWLAFEQGLGPANTAQADAVQAKLPERVVKRRALSASDGTAVGFQEYYDYVFPDDESNKGIYNLMALSKAMAAGDLDLDDLDDEEEEEGGEGGGSQAAAAAAAAGGTSAVQALDASPTRVGGVKRKAEAAPERPADDNELDIDDI